MFLLQWPKNIYKFDYPFKRYKRFTLGGGVRYQISKNSTQGKVGTKINNLQPHGYQKTLKNFYTIIASFTMQN